MGYSHRICTFVIGASLILACRPVPLGAQQTAQGPAFSLPDRIRISERSNYSTRENGRYSGLLNRQVTGYLTRTEESDYEGRFFLYEQVRRDLQEVARPVDRSFESRLTLTPLSLFSSSDDYPSIQDVPALPGRSLRPGDTWEARAWISIDPRRSRNVLRLPVAVGYRYAGLETWNGSPAHRVEAQFATRYPLPPSDDPNAPTVAYDGPITAVTGRHTMTIVIPVPPADGQVRGDVAFIRDEVAEQYLFSDRNELTVHGHTLLFLSAHAVETLQRVAESVERSMRETEVADVSVDRTATGVRLTVRSLRFLPDQAVLLPEERGRLDSVAEALGALDAQRFLVVGHTADVGSEESQRRLSIERARVIAAELAARGIARDRLDIEGRGGSEPVASNETDEGRARNRRVEIYIVEE